MEGAFQNRRAGTAPSAFTLLELLVSLAVVLVLAVLLFSLSPSISAQSKERRCVANQRSLHQAINLFAIDHSGGYPLWTSSPADPGKNWHRSVWPYLSPLGTYGNWGSPESLRLYRCPANPSTTSAISYAMNDNLKDKRLTAVGNRTLVLIDHAESQLVNGIQASMNQRIKGWHDGGNVITFADGHSETIALRDIPDRTANPAFWGLQTN